MESENPKPNRELTNEIFEFDTKEIFSYTGGDYKPWWSPCDDGELYVRGWNSVCSPGDRLIDHDLDTATEEGRIVKNNRDGTPAEYMIEVHVKVIKLKNIEE